MIRFFEAETVCSTTRSNKQLKRRFTMKMSIKTVLAAAAMAVAVAGTADATLVTIGQAHYSGSSVQASDNDGSYNLVWDNDSPFGSVVYLDYTNAYNTWANQVAWASILNSALTYTINAGYSVDWGTNSWRLPTTVDGLYNYGENGTTTAGYNITNSEFGHLYYTELGNKGYVNTSNNYQPGYGLTNRGDLTNLQPDWYWSGTEYAYNPTIAWNFDTRDGSQLADSKDDFTSGMLGLAVRSGQVSEVAPVPEPSTLLLLGGGLAGLVFAGRRKTRG
jgi:hypothetical protein